MKTDRPLRLTGICCFLCLLINGCRNPGPGFAGPVLDGRGDRLLEAVAETYQPTTWHDRGKYSFPVVIARMSLYGNEDERANAYISEYEGDSYGFFHFPFVGMARIMGQFPEAPSLVRNREDFLERILYHEAGNHYNALTAEGTENHVSMSRTSGYIFAQEAMRYPRLRNRAVEWENLLKNWILAWAKRIYAYGTGEWDSGVYTTYNLIGWLNLYDFAKDAEVRDAARAVLDYYAANIALKYTQGILGGAESRAGTRFEGLPRSSTDYLAWLWFGGIAGTDREDFFATSEYIQAVHAATSSYRPPAALIPLARKEVPVPALYRNNKPDYLLLEKAESREEFLIGETFTLGTVQTPHGGWLNTAYGVLNWKLVMMNPEGPPAVLVGNGGMKSHEHARGRNPFDQFLQYRNVVVQMTRVPSNAEAIEAEVDQVYEQYRVRAQEDFAARWGGDHRFSKDPFSTNARGDLEKAGVSILYLPDQVTLELDGARAVGRFANTVFHMHTLSGKPVEQDGSRLMDRAGRDRICGFVVEVFNSGDPGTENLKAPLTRGDEQFVYRTGMGELLEFRYVTNGSWKEMIYDWGFGVKEQRVSFNTADWRQPDWPSGEGHGRIPELRVNGHKPPHPGPETVLSGPRLSLSGAVLVIHDIRGNPLYEVDYRGPLPLFSQPQ